MRSGRVGAIWIRRVTAETKDEKLRRLIREGKRRRIIGDWLMIGAVVAIVGGIIWAALTQ